MTIPHTQGARVTVVGAARSGLAAARLLTSHGARVLLTERRALAEATVQSLKQLGITCESGGHTKRALAADFVVLSPGVPPNSMVPQGAAERRIPCYSELEVASWFAQGTLVAITGSNGKTTTTSLVGHVFKQAGYDTIVAGNIGTPLSAYADTTRPESIVVVEVSSFQLEYIATFRPRVSVVLNITPDHLDRYGGDFALYAKSKLRISMNQTRSGDILVYNHDDTLVRGHAAQWSSTSGGQAIPFTSHESLPTGASVQDGTIALRQGNVAESLMPTSDLSLPGPHNLQNSMAAALVAHALEVPLASVREGLRSFKGLPHRMETVRDAGGVRWVNDSKATNVESVRCALQSYAAPAVLLMGGRDKGNDYQALESLVQHQVRTLVAFGESAGAVIQALGPHAGEARRVHTLEQAVRAARDAARPGDVVLLSPACASFDQFESYEHRGDAFRELVNSV